jgi:uncharacterized protein YegP (UPF0339 family)
MKFYIFKDSQGYWRWHLMSANNKIVADSAEGYVNEHDCLVGIGLVMDTNRNTPVYKR